MKRKLLKSAAAVLSAAMLLSMTGCEAKEDPRAVLNAAMTKNVKMSDSDMDLSMDISLGKDGMFTSVKYDGNMKVSGVNTENMLYLADIKMDMFAQGESQTIDTVTFYQDGYCYTETMGTKLKYAVDLESMIGTISQSTDFVSMDTSYFKDLTLKKNGDARTISFTTDPSQMKEYVSKIMGAMGGGLTGGEDAEISVSQLSGSYTIGKNGYFTGADLDMVMDMDVSGVTCGVTLNMKVTYNNPGQPVEVVIPDTEGYEEVNMTDMMAQ